MNLHNKILSATDPTKTCHDLPDRRRPQDTRLVKNLCRFSRFERDRLYSTQAKLLALGYRITDNYFTNIYSGNYLRVKYC